MLTQNVLLSTGSFFAGYMVSEILDILEGVGAASLTRKEIWPAKEEFEKEKPR